MIEDARAEIDQINKDIVELFERRTKLVEEIARYKFENNIDILDRSREEKVIQTAQSYLNDESLSDEVKELFQMIMKISRDHQYNWMEDQ